MQYTSHAVDDFLKSCPAYILNAAEKFSVNAEGVDDKTIGSWTDRLILIAKECAEIKNNSTVSAEIVQNVLTKRKAIDEATESAEKATLALIEKEFEAKKTSFNADNDEIVKQVRAMLLSNKSNGDDMEEDIQLMDKGLQQSDIICPYSRLQFSEPMKSTLCKHIVDRESLKAMLRNKVNPVPCPVSGCAGMWTMTNSSVDEQFKLKMQRYLRRKEAAAFSSSEDSNATVIG
mmetsp:Transcript_32495/g.46855  ORF Transcript_32495/g.46855 Transcript_32495/m.46855 type:complete len:232 (-) Transcript_32495:58-753(-)